MLYEASLSLIFVLAAEFWLTAAASETDLYAKVIKEIGLVGQ